jgi:hypothetical protein
MFNGLDNQKFDIAKLIKEKVYGREDYHDTFNLVKFDQ